MSKEFQHIKVEKQFQAACGIMLLAEIKCKNITQAINYFNDHIDHRISGWEIYRDGKLKYTYDRATDRLLPVKVMTI